MERIRMSHIRKQFTIGGSSSVSSAAGSKALKSAEHVVRALKDLSLSIQDGEFVAIMGKSGSGKSTLINIIGCMDVPSSGEYLLDGNQIETLSGAELADIRNQKIGFVFQKFNLLPRTSALENVALPLLYDRSNRVKDPHARAAEVLNQVGLGDRMDHEPNQLSGGQQQRVAIARALVNYPSIVLADEPTGNLDSKTTLEVMALFQALHEQGITLVVVTHERDVAEYATRLIELRDGLVLKDEPIQQRRSARDELAAFLATEVSEGAATLSTSGNALPIPLPVQFPTRTQEMGI